MMKIYNEMISERFGVRAGKTDESELSVGSLDERLKSWGESLDLVVARIDFTQLVLINQLEKRGFTTKDVQCILRRDSFKDQFTPGTPFVREDGYVFRDFEESDTQQIVDITRQSFVGYGHWFADERLDQKDSLEVYVDWSYRLCTEHDPSVKIFVAEKDGEVAAYISYKKFVDGDKIYAAGALGAVNSKHRKKGLYHDLSGVGLRWASDSKLDWKEHSVHISNFPVIRSFTSVGFRPHKFVATLHGWLDEI